MSGAYFEIIMDLETEGPIKQCCEWQMSNMGVKSWAVELKDEWYNIGLALVWSKKHECNVGDMIRIVKERCNGIERQNLLAKCAEKRSLKMYREFKFVCRKKLYIEWREVE